MRLVLAEDHTLLRAGMIQLLEANGFTILHAADDEPSLVEALRDPDADAAVVNTNFALAAGISPREDSIAMEKADSPYANVIAVRKGDEEQPWLKTLVEVYHSPEIKNYIETKYEGAVIPAW